MPTASHTTSTTRTLINPKDGASLDTPYTSVEAAEIIRPHMKGDKFLTDLVDIVDLEGEKSKQMTAGRLYWLHKKALALRGIRERECLGNFKPVFDMFAKAALKLQNPKILLRGPLTVGIKPASLNSRNVGSLYVMSGLSFNECYWGKINADGEFTVGRHNPPKELLPFLREFAKNPLEIAAKSGKLSGSCCFCRRTLTDPVSVSNGYGPICAKRFGLA